jgi:hypothetical protein
MTHLPVLLALTLMTVSGGDPGDPDLALTRSAPAQLVRGAEFTYTLTVTNAGAGETFGPVGLRDRLPPELTVVGVQAPGWVCAAVLGVRCFRFDELGPGLRYPPVVVTVAVAADAPDQLDATAIVSTVDDDVPGNDTAAIVWPVVTAVTPPPPTPAPPPPGRQPPPPAAAPPAVSSLAAAPTPTPQPAPEAAAPPAAQVAEVPATAPSPAFAEALSPVPEAPDPPSHPLGDLSPTLLIILLLVIIGGGAVLTAGRS